MTTETEPERRVPEHPGWRPWWVRVAEFDGQRLHLIDSARLPEEIQRQVDAEMRVPAAVPAHAFDDQARYWVRCGPVPCLHLGQCPFPGKDHAEELYATDSLAEAEAAFEEAARRLVEEG